MSSEEEGSSPEGSGAAARLLEARHKSTCGGGGFSGGAAAQTDRSHGVEGARRGPTTAARLHSLRHAITQHLNGGNSAARNRSGGTQQQLPPKDGAGGGSERRAPRALRGAVAVNVGVSAGQTRPQLDRSDCAAFGGGQQGIAVGEGATGPPGPGSDGDASSALLGDLGWESEPRQPSAPWPTPLTGSRPGSTGGGASADDEYYYTSPLGAQQQGGPPGGKHWQAEQGAAEGAPPAGFGALAGGPTPCSGSKWHGVDDGAVPGAASISDSGSAEAEPGGGMAGADAADDPCIEREAATDTGPQAPQLLGPSSSLHPARDDPWELADKMQLLMRQAAALVPMLMESQAARSAAHTTGLEAELARLRDDLNATRAKLAAEAGTSAAAWQAATDAVQEAAGLRGALAAAEAAEAAAAEEARRAREALEREASESACLQAELEALRRCCAPGAGLAGGPEAGGAAGGWVAGADGGRGGAAAGGRPSQFLATSGVRGEMLPHLLVAPPAACEGWRSGGPPPHQLPPRCAPQQAAHLPGGAAPEALRQQALPQLKPPAFGSFDDDSPREQLAPEAPQNVNDQGTALTPHDSIVPGPPPPAPRGGTGGPPASWLPPQGGQAGAWVHNGPPGFASRGYSGDCSMGLALPSSHPGPPPFWAGGSGGNGAVRAAGARPGMPPPSSCMQLAGGPAGDGHMLRSGSGGLIMGGAGAAQHQMMMRPQGPLTYQPVASAPARGPPLPPVPHPIPYPSTAPPQGPLLPLLTVPGDAGLPARSGAAARRGGGYNRGSAY
jgi:hypothetical protein